MLHNRQSHSGQRLPLTCVLEYHIVAWKNKWREFWLTSDNSPIFSLLFCSWIVFFLVRHSLTSKYRASFEWIVRDMHFVNDIKDLLLFRLSWLEANSIHFSGHQPENELLDWVVKPQIEAIFAAHLSNSATAQSEEEEEKMGRHERWKDGK